MAFDNVTDVKIANLALGRLGSANINLLSDKDDVNMTNLYAQVRDQLLTQYDWNFARTRKYLIPKTYTATNFVFNNANPDTITQATALLISSGGFRDGDKVLVTGGTNDGKTFTIATAAAGTLTLISTDEVAVQATGTSIILERKPANEYGYCFQLPTNYLGNPELDSSESNFEVEDGYIFCDDYELNLIYTKQVTDPTKFSTLFIECLVLALAGELAIPIANDRALRNDILQELQYKLLNAFFINAYDGKSEKIKDTSWQIR